MKRILFAIILVVVLIYLVASSKRSPVNEIETRILVESQGLIDLFDYDPLTNMIYYAVLAFDEDQNRPWSISLHRFDIENEATFDLIHPQISIDHYSVDSFLSILRNGQVVVLGNDALLFFEDDRLVKTIPLLNFEVKKCNEDLAELEDLLLKSADLKSLGYIRSSYSSFQIFARSDSPRFLIGDGIAFDLRIYRNCELPVNKSILDLISEPNLSLRNPDANFNYEKFTPFRIKSEDFQIRYRPYGYLFYEFLCEHYVEQIIWDRLIWQSNTACNNSRIIESLPVSGYVFINDNEFIYQHISLFSIVASRKL